MDNLFSSTPPWVSWVLADYGNLGTLQEHQERRAQAGMAERPWLEYLATLPPFDPTAELVMEICAQNKTVQPISLESFPKVDLKAFFPAEIADKYQVIAFNREDIFLSLVLLEPDILVPMYKEYVVWAKSKQPSVLQFFITTPEQWHAYKDKLSPGAQ